MLRTVVRLSPSFIPIFQNAKKYDNNELEERSTEKPNTGWDRIKKMYSKNEFDEVSIELHTVAQASMSGAFIGACLGGFVKSKDAYIYFIENNQATIFKTTIEAKKKLQDYVTVAFAKGACQWGWRLGIFTGMFSLITTTLSVYRGDTSLVEYIIAGAITGGLYKVNLGLAATFVGAGLGAALSTAAGLAILGLLKITGFSMADIRKAMYRLKESREDQYNQAVEKGAKIKNDDLTKHHDNLVEEKGMKNVDEL